LEKTKSGLLAWKAVDKNSLPDNSGKLQAALATDPVLVRPAPGRESLAFKVDLSNPENPSLLARGEYQDDKQGVRFPCLPESRVRFKQLVALIRQIVAADR
jgi:hypothetical protein